MCQNQNSKRKSIRTKFPKIVLKVTWVSGNSLNLSRQKVLIDVILTDGKNMIANEYKMVNGFKTNIILTLLKTQWS